MSDPSSFANIEEVSQVHVSFVITVDFERKVFSGHVDITATVHGEEATTFVLDTKGLDIHSVELTNTNTPLQVHPSVFFGVLNPKSFRLVVPPILARR
jgi:aminopeptidase N